MAEQQKNAVLQKNSHDAFVLTRLHLEEFLHELERTDHSPSTIDNYRGNLLSFYDFLPQNKLVDAASLPAWRDSLFQNGYSPRSVNNKTSAVNSFYNFLGRRDWQVTGGKRMQPERLELTREEYRKLLDAAKRQKKFKLYMLIKVMATTDLTPGDMPLLTLEALQQGVITGKNQGEDSVRLPRSLQKELLEYAARWKVLCGPVFAGEAGKCYSRVYISHMVGALAEDTGLEPGKANPRNLRRLYQHTMAEFRREAERWAAEQCSHYLNGESLDSGLWEYAANN